MAAETIDLPDAPLLAKLALGMEQYRACNYAAAGEIFERLQRQKADHPMVLRMLGLCRLRLGDISGAVLLHARAYELSPADPETRLHYGIALLASGRTIAATRHFRACIDLLPDDPAPPLNLAAALVQAGDLPGARLAARKAKLRASSRPEVHYTLGLIALADGGLAQAANAFRQTTSLAPDFVEAWVNLGIVRYRQGNIMAARHAMSRALRVAPHHPVATANLAVLLRLCGEIERSDEMLQGAIHREASAAEAKVNRVTTLLGEDQFAEAAALLDGPPPNEPRLALHWRLQRIIVLLHLNRAEEARALLGTLGLVPSAFRPLALWRQVLLAVTDHDIPAARAHAESMHIALADGHDVLPEHRIMGYFDLGQFWSSRGEPDRAFPLWAEGHRHLAVFQPFSRSEYLAFVDATIREFGRPRMQDGPRARNAGQAPVFVVGMPRSGTTLLEQILASHRDVHGAGERNALALTFGSLGGATESVDAVRRVARLGAESLDAAAASYLAELHAIAPDAARIVDKMPGNFRYLGLVALMLPGARIIHCARDPRDIALSIFTYRFYGYHPYAHDITDLGWYIAQYQRLMRHWIAASPSQIITVHLQDWISDFDHTVRRVLEFLDLPYDPACERFYELERRVLTVSRRQVRSPINARGLGRWRVFAHHLQPMIEEMQQAGGDLETWC